MREYDWWQGYAIRRRFDCCERQDCWGDLSIHASNFLIRNLYHIYCCNLYNFISSVMNKSHFDLWQFDPTRYNPSWSNACLQTSKLEEWDILDLTVCIQCSYFDRTFTGVALSHKVVINYMYMAAENSILRLKVAFTHARFADQQHRCRG